MAREGAKVETGGCPESVACFISTAAIFCHCGSIILYRFSQYWKLKGKEGIKKKEGMTWVTRELALSVRGHACPFVEVGGGLVKTQADQLSFHPGPESRPWVDPPQHPSYHELLELVKGPVLRGHCHRISMTLGNGRISEKTQGKGPVLMVIAEARFLKPD